MFRFTLLGRLLLVNELSDIPRRIRGVKSREKNEGFKLFLMASPFLALTLLFCYLPLYGWVYAFFDYNPPIPLSKSTFVGLYWFKTLISSPVQIKQILQVLENTFAISFLGILFSWVPLAFAVCLNEVHTRWLKRGIQTLTTLPYFISWVLVFSMAFSLFSASGAANNVLQTLGLTKSPIMFLSQDNHTYLEMALWQLWKYIGWDAILYFATIAGIDQELYEAARVDGANHFRLMWHITVPCCIPTFFVLLLLSIANFLNNGVDQFYVFQNSFNQAHIQVLDLYVYNVGVKYSAYSLATAIGMLKSLISVVLLFSCNRLSKVVRGETIV